MKVPDDRSQGASTERIQDEASQADIESHRRSAEEAAYAELEGDDQKNASKLEEENSIVVINTKPPEELRQEKVIIKKRRPKRVHTAIKQPPQYKLVHYNIKNLERLLTKNFHLDRGDATTQTEPMNWLEYMNDGSSKTELSKIISPMEPAEKK